MLPQTIPEKLKLSPPVALSNKFHYINGEFVKPKAKTTVPTMDPCYDTLIVNLPCAEQEEVDAAFQAAESARVSWSKSPISLRVKILNEIADKIEQDISRLALIESWDCGKAYREAEADMNDVVANLRYTASLGDKLQSELKKEIGKSGKYTISRILHPIGVVCLITPWNYPLLMAIQKVSMSIISGCPCVLKPSEYASLTCIELANIISSTQLPNGVFNLIIGDGKSAGDKMIQNKLARKISFTGSVNTGKHIMSVASKNLCPVHLELGGKSCMIVMDDCDINTCIDWVILGIYWGAGQVCSATSRVIIHEKIYNEFLRALKQRVIDNINIDKSILPTTTLGPLVSKPQYEKVLTYLDKGKEEKLEVLFGGKKEKPESILNSADKNLAHGYFLYPTCYMNVPFTSKLWNEEIFGPVLCVNKFSNVDEAIKIANNTSYGLGAAVMTKDEKVKEHITYNLEAGSVWENCSQPVVMAAGQPFGGCKDSGFGKEMGWEGLLEYMHSKTVITTPFGHSEGLYGKL